MTVGIWEVPAQRATPDITRFYDTAWIQQAVDACKAAGGGIVHLGPGTFVLDATVAIDGTDVVVRGSGPATLIRNRFAGYAFTVTGTRNGVRDLRIDSESVGTGGVNVTGASAPSVENVLATGHSAQPILGSTYVREGNTYKLGGGLSWVDLKLTDTQIKALRATPQTLVPAPGAGYGNMLASILMHFDVTTTAYSESSDNIAVEYSGGTDLLVLEMTGFIDQTSDQTRFQSMAEAVYTPVANEAIQLFNNGDGEFGSGNAANTLSVRAYYHMIPMAAFG